MATIFSPSAVLSSTATTSTSTSKPKHPPKSHNHPPPVLPTKTSNIPITLTLTATAAAILLSTTPLTHAEPTSAFHLYYGTASSAANYGGLGGNADKKASAEYVYEVPDGWKERLVSKVEKGTNGTDSEFYNPKKRTEKVYLTFLAGFRSLAPMDAVLGNIALSDVVLQDLIATADSVKSVEMKDENGQVYYVYEIDGGGGGAHSLISVTCANNKLYAHFVNAPKPEWNRDETALRRIHESFKTVVNKS